MDALLILITFLAPIVAALTQIIKDKVPSKYHALIPIVLGLVLGMVAGPLLPALGIGALSFGSLVWAGLLAGLTASGVYSVQNIRNKKE